MASEPMTAEEWAEFLVRAHREKWPIPLHWDYAIIFGRAIAAKVAEEHAGLRGEVAELLAMRDADALIISQAGRDLAAAWERIAELEAALKEACDEYEYAAKYKGDYLATKHEDAATLARLRAALPGDGPDAKGEK